MKHDKQPARFYYLTGADGTGKSTQSRLLMRYLAGRGIRCRHVWLRFPLFFSLPLLAFARLRGCSWHEVSGGVNHGYWDFTHCWVMRTIFPWVMLVDAMLTALFKIYLPLMAGRTVVCERFVYDMLVDLTVAVQDPTITMRTPARLFLALLPRASRVAVLDLDEATIRSRRPDLILDHALTQRLDTFRQIAAQRQLPVVDSTPPIAEVHREILATLEAL